MDVKIYQVDPTNVVGSCNSELIYTFMRKYKTSYKYNKILKCNIDPKIFKLFRMFESVNIEINESEVREISLKFEKHKKDKIVSSLDYNESIRNLTYNKNIKHVCTKTNINFVLMFKIIGKYIKNDSKITLGLNNSDNYPLLIEIEVDNVMHKFMVANQLVE